jgi:hypothetical protein
MGNAAENDAGPGVHDTHRPCWRTEEKMNERVSELAAGLWNSAGRKSGRDLDFWLMAEKMVLQDLEWRARHAIGNKQRP